MDLRDFHIILELQRNPFASYDAIGKTLRITGAAVKSRLERMEREGVFLGICVTPRPQTLRRFWHIFAYLDIGPDVDVGPVLEVENVVSVWRGPSGEMMVNSYDSAANAVAPKELNKIAGGEPVGVVSLDPPGDGDPSDSTLSSLDWRVLDALLDGPRASLVELSSRTGLSRKTVRRRRESLLLKQQIITLPNIDTTKEPGLIVYAGYVGVKRQEDLDGINIPGLVIFRRLYHPPAGWFIGHALTLAEVQSVERKLKATLGVERVDLGPSRPTKFATKHLHAWARAEIKRWNAYRRKTKRGP